MIDQIDRQIIRELIVEGRLSHRELGERIGLSPNATGVRVASLVADGVITGVHAHVDQVALGRPIEAYVDGWLVSREDEQWAKFEAFVFRDDRILEAVHLTGKLDYRLRVVVSTPTELDELLSALKRHAATAETDTKLILRQHPVGGGVIDALVP